MGVGVGLYMYDFVVKKFTFAISSPDEFLVFTTMYSNNQRLYNSVKIHKARG